MRPQSDRLNRASAIVISTLLLFRPGGVLAQEPAPIPERSPVSTLLVGPTVGGTGWVLFLIGKSGFVWKNPDIPRAIREAYTQAIHSARVGIDFLLVLGTELVRAGLLPGHPLAVGVLLRGLLLVLPLV